MTPFYLLILFAAKTLDDALKTAKGIFLQNGRCILAGISVTLSNFIYLSITKNIITTNSTPAMAIVSIASGVGCCLAMLFNNRFSRDRTYVNVIMSDDLDAMKAFRDFLVENKITSNASETYTLDWSEKTLCITAYAETK